MSVSRSLKSGMFFLSLEKGINGSITIALIPVMIQTIGVDNFGLWGVLLGIIGYIQCLDLGISLSIERFVAFFAANNDRNSLEKLLSTSFTALILITTALAIPVILGGEHLLKRVVNDSSEIPLQKIIVSVYPGIVMSWITFVFTGVPRGLQRFDISSKIQIAGKIMFAITLLALFKRTRTIFAVIFAFDVQCFLLLVTYIHYARRLLPGIAMMKPSISIKMLKDIINFGYKIQISSFYTQINQQFDKLLLSYFYDLALVGYYDAASRIVFAARDIPHFLVAVITPRISFLSAKGDDEEIQNLFEKVTGSLVVIGFMIGGCMLINGSLIMEFLLKDKSNPFALLVFNTLCISALWQAMAAGSANVARGLGKTNIEMKTTIFLLVINIAASFALMRLVGYRGVVFGTAITMIISPLISYYLVSKELRSPFKVFLVRTFTLPCLVFFAASSIVLAAKGLSTFTVNRWLEAGVLTSFFLLITCSSYLLARYRPFMDMVQTVNHLVKGTSPKHME